jgi:hypothetical protein
MAEFNPEVPNTRVRDPEWTNVSRPISDVPYDKSSSIAISGAADILTSATKAVDFEIKEKGKEDVHAAVDPLRDSYIAGLQTVRNAQIAASDKSLLPDDAQGNGNVPPTVQNGIDKAKTIATAMEQNAGKSNTTLYTGALNSLTKTLRAQYPGYRDYIDEQIAAISGVHPANAFMKDLAEDINRQSDANKTEHNATLATLRSNADNGFHDKSGVSAAQVYGLVSKGLMPPEKAMTWLNSAKSVDYDRKVANDARTDRNANDADAAVSAQKDLAVNANKNISHDWQTLTLGKGTDTAEGLFKFIQSNAGNEKVKDEQSQAIGQQLVQLRNASYKMRVAEAAEGGKDSVLAHMGGDPKKVNDVLDASYKTFDLAIDAVFHKDWGAAYSHMNFNKAITADTTNTMYNAPDAEVAKYNRNVAVINQISPQFAKDFFTGFVTGDNVKKDVEWLKTQKLDMLVQPDAPNGQIHTLQEQLNKARQVGATAPKTVKALVTSIDEVSNPKIDPSQRLNLAKGFFDPAANGEILSDKNFVKDQYDPTLKRTIDGKYWVWRKLSSDNTATGIAELGKKDPSIVQDYRDTMTRNFGEQLFSRELRDVGQSNQDNNPNGLYKIKFSDDKGRSPHFDIIRPDGSPMTMTEAIAMRAPVGATNRLNEGMSGLYNVYEKTGSSDPISDVKTAIFRYNYNDPKEVNNSPGRTESLTGSAKAIWQSMIAAQTERLKKIQGRQAEPE